MVAWARKHGIQSTIHTGGPSVPGSGYIDADTVLAADADIIGHINGGHTALPLRQIRCLCEGCARAIEIVHNGNELAGLSALAAGAQWGRLRAELDRCEAELATSRAQTQELRRLAAAAVARRDELRGLLGAYKAKAARLGASEDVAVSGRYDQARDLLWSAPCDLGAAEAAVSGYQQAILATERRR